MNTVVVFEMANLTSVSKHSKWGLRKEDLSEIFYSSTGSEERKHEVELDEILVSEVCY